MSETASGEILEYTDEEHENFQNRIAAKAGEATGREIKQAEINPDDRSSFKKIEEYMNDMQHDVGHMASSTISGGEDAKIRIAQHRAPTIIAAKRWVQKNVLRKAA